jgi:hypothetical protein
MPRYGSIFPRAKPVIYIRSERPRRRTKVILPILRLVAVASIALVVMAGIMASGRAQETCLIGPSDQNCTFDHSHRECRGLLTTTLIELTPS